MNNIVYALCAATSLLCAVLLYRSYFRGGPRLLLWSAIAFTILTLSNVVLYLDFALLPGTNLADLRIALTLTGALTLLFGLIWEDVR